MGERGREWQFPRRDGYKEEQYLDAGRLFLRRPFSARLSIVVAEALASYDTVELCDKTRVKSRSKIRRRGGGRKEIARGREKWKEWGEGGGGEKA